MEKLLCSSCGSNEFENKDNVIVCKYCGTQYVSQLTEEQLKIKAEVDRIIKSADLSLGVQDWSRAESIYDKILDLDPSNIEMVFFMAYCRMRESMQVSNSPLERQNIASVLMNSFDVVKNKFNFSTVDSVVSIEKFGKYVNDLFNASYVYNVKTDKYGFEQENNSDETKIIIVQIVMKFVLMIEDIIHKYSVNDQSIQYIRRLNEVSAKLLNDADMEETIPLNNDDLVNRVKLLQQHIAERKRLFDAGGDIITKFKEFEGSKEKVNLNASEFNIENSNLTWYEILGIIFVIYYIIDKLF